MPSKTNTGGKSSKQKKDNQPKEETPRAEVTETEGETKETVEEMSPSAVDGQTAKKSKDELWEECVSLQEELTKLQRTNFKTERDMALRSWENSKRNLEEIKARMRVKLRLKQEAEECRQAEIKEHQLKLTQLVSAHHSEICELKMAAGARTSKTIEEHVDSEFKLHRKLHLVQVERREREYHREIYLEKLQQEQQHELLELNDSYKQRVKEMEAEYDNKMKKMFKETNTKTEAGFEEIDDRMSINVVNVMQQHEKAWRGLQMCMKNEDGFSLKKLERELEDMKDMDKQLNRRMAAAEQRNKRLKQSLQEMKQKLSESHQELTVQRIAMVKRLKRSNRITARILKERRDLYMKNQQLELKHEQAQQEYDELQKKQTEVILDLQQKSDLRVLVQERKIEAMTEILEKEQLKLWMALAFGQGDQTAAKSIAELFESKHATIKALKNDISRVSMEHDILVKKATALNLSVDKAFSTGDYKKSFRKASQDCKKFDDLMQELMALHISEGNSVQKDVL